MSRSPEGAGVALVCIGSVAFYGTASLTVALLTESIVAGAVAGMVAATAAYLLWGPARLGGALEPRTAVAGALALALTFFVGQVLSSWAYARMGDPVYDANVAAESTASPLAAAMVVLLVMPVAEELLMRGVVYSRLRTVWPAWAAVLVVSACFAVMHGNLVQGVLALPLGVTMCLLYEASGAVWVPILAHMAFNAAALSLDAAWLSSALVPVAVVAAAPLGALWVWLYRMSPSAPSLRSM